MRALDPAASQTLHVIACFDELMVGNVNTRALLSAAAALAGCPAGHRLDRPAREMRVDNAGHLITEPSTTAWPVHDVADGHHVWLEREGPPLTNDAMIIERLALALRLRHSHSRSELDLRRDLGIAIDSSSSSEDRAAAAARLGLRAGTAYRVLVAPLFAIWTHHPSGPEDVVTTPHGTLHTVVVPATGTEVTCRPLGIGTATDIDRLHRSFATALVALRLCDHEIGSVDAASYGGLIDLLADLPDDAEPAELAMLGRIMLRPWGAATVQALVEAGSVRQAARMIDIHHSTMQSRLDQIADELGFDPLEGYGRTRLGVAWLIWRMRHSRALDLPPA